MIIERVEGCRHNWHTYRQREEYRKNAAAPLFGFVIEPDLGPVVAWNTVAAYSG